LIEEYGYPREDLECFFTINVGRAKKRPDIAIFRHGESHVQSSIFIIVEAKTERVKPEDKDSGVGQLESYLSACPNAQYGIWVGSELRAYEVSTQDGIRKPIETTDAPRFGKEAPTRITFRELVPAHKGLGERGLRQLFRRCHNYIYANQGLQKEAAFHEFLKLIFCKVHDELNSSGEMRFDISPEERRSEIKRRQLRKRMEQLFDEVKERYPHIFREDERIQLNDRVLAYIVSELRRYSLLQTTADVKGNAYEEIVGPNLRGDRGEFFTPRNVCKMATDIVFSTFLEERWLDLRVLDPACGTGGFLIMVKNLWREVIEKQEKQKWASDDEVLRRTYSRLRDVCNANLFGIDLNPALVRACQMNVIMHGGEQEDGSRNILAADSLKPPNEWESPIREKVKLGSFDVVLTNPPFGAGPGLAIDDPYILGQFGIAKFETESPRNSIPPERLFIERCWQFLKPGGRMAIVLPDSILSNPGLVWLRHWIMKYAEVISSVDLPTETFQAHGGTGTQTSVLVLRKKTLEEIRIEEQTGKMRDYEIFMALCATAGYDRRGNDLWVRTPEGELIVGPDKEPVSDDDVSHVAPIFARWMKEKRLRW
jgi:type I restriction enzyme M protein